MPSAVIPSQHSYPAMLLAEQLVHQWLRPPGPLVLGRDPFKFPRPRQIRTELSCDVLNPARVPLSWANSPTLGTFSSPRMRRADIEVPNGAVDMDSWAPSACYPRSSFYPMSSGSVTRNQRITSSYFRTCSTCQSCSQAGLWRYPYSLVSIEAKPTFERLRYSLGGDRPSQTTHLPLFSRCCEG
jgi:hypothetical protein